MSTTTAAPTITLKQVVTTLRQIVHEAGPGFRYAPFQGNACFYRQPEYVGAVFDHSEGAAGCIVGQFLDRVDLLPAKLYPPTTDPRSVGAEPWANVENQGPIALLDKFRRHGHIEDVEPDAAAFLAKIQTDQDGGATWETALYRAELYAGTLDHWRYRLMIDGFDHGLFDTVDEAWSTGRSLSGTTGHPYVLDAVTGELVR